MAWTGNLASQRPLPDGAAEDREGAALGGLALLIVRQSPRESERAAVLRAVSGGQDSLA